jgi:hypothetical protein
VEARENGGITRLRLVFKPYPAAGNHSHTAGASNLAAGSFQLHRSRISRKRERWRKRTHRQFFPLVSWFKLILTWLVALDEVLRRESVRQIISNATHVRLRKSVGEGGLEVDGRFDVDDIRKSN